MSKLYEAMSSYYKARAGSASGVAFEAAGQIAGLASAYFIETRKRANEKLKEFDVYLENIADGTVASDKFLGLDSNNKIVKEAITSSSGDIEGVTAGTNLSGGGTTGTVTINLADASTSATGTKTCCTLCITIWFIFCKSNCRFL